MSSCLFHNSGNYITKKQEQTRKSTNWWGSAKCDDTHPRATVICNALSLIPKTFMHAHASIYSYVQRDCDSNMKSAIYVTRKRQQVHLSPIFRDKKQKNISTVYTTENDALKSPFSKNCKSFQNQLNGYREISNRT